MGRIVLVTGGARSGKSKYAEQTALKISCKKPYYLATAEVTDDEMKNRIQIHKQNRGNLFCTIEEPLDIVGALKEVECKTDTVLIDCLTVWLGNLFFHGNNNLSYIDNYTNSLLSYLNDTNLNIVLVTNETGSGIVPETELGRLYRDKSGFLNQKIAEIATDVILSVCGIQIVIKGGSIK